MSQISKETTPPEVIPFGSHNNWITYDLSHEKLLKKQKVRSVKVVFYEQEKDNTLSYLVSLKRSGKSQAKKDGRYEFLGGKVDKKEKILDALLRETTEEDPSLVLAKQLKWIYKNKPQLLKYKIIYLKNGSFHALFIAPIDKKEWRQLKDFYQKEATENSETYGIEKIDSSYFSLSKDKKINWTPQTIRIFKALRKEVKN